MNNLLRYLNWLKEKNLSLTTHEVSEDNYFRYPSGINREGFLLGENEQITFSFVRTILKIYYQIGIVAYQKTLDLPLNGEIIFEFTEQDRLNSS